VAAGGAAVVLLALAVAVGRDAGRSAPAPPPATTGPACPTTGPDLDGDGCVEPVQVRGVVVATDGRRWRVGEGGDLAAVADWDCDGRATAAVVRPATGEVWVYDGWAGAGRTVTARRPGPTAPGATEVRAVPGPSGCVRLEVTTAGGDRRLLDLG
jgi:hypothetical protein